VHSLYSPAREYATNASNSAFLGEISVKTQIPFFSPFGIRIQESFTSGTPSLSVSLQAIVPVQSESSQSTRPSLSLSCSSRHCDSNLFFSSESELAAAAQMLFELCAATMPETNIRQGIKIKISSFQLSSYPRGMVL
jgi:hypothetical protein